MIYPLKVRHLEFTSRQKPMHRYFSKIVSKIVCLNSLGFSRETRYLTKIEFFKILVLKFWFLSKHLKKKTI